MEEKNLSEEESLGLINQMIRVARDEHRESGEGWLIWGWLLFIASVLSVVFSWSGMGRYIGFTWTAMLALGMVIYLFGHVRKQQMKKVKTYVQELLDKLGTAFFVSLFLMIAASNIRGDQSFGFGYYYILYAFWMYIHGSAIRFKPLLVGALVNWAAAIAIFLIKDFSYDMIVSAIAVLVGYLIPGYMLKAEYKRNYLKDEKGLDGV
jgi:Flp pilus assembly protein TadB